MTLSAGTRLGPYEILGPLGAGGMGEVYRARDTRLGRDVAVKVLPEGLAASPNALARFEREARAVAALAHPNILALYDVGQTDGLVYAVTELLEGDSLRQRLSRESLPVRRAVEVGIAVAEGLAAAHAKGIVHRDLKPENVFLTSDGRVKILDFGLARMAEPLVFGGETSSPTSGPTTPAPTEPGVVMGTPGYMSPEQVRGQPADVRSDTFSFGAVLYEMITGERAFSRGTAGESMAAILRDQPPAASRVVPELLPGIDHALLRCLEKSPDERFQSARDLAYALREAFSTPTGAATALPAPAERRRRLRPLLWALGAAAGIAMALIAGLRLGRVEPPSYQQLSFRRGTILSARFASKGQSVVYGAAWNGKPFKLFTTTLTGPESRELDLPAADILSVSPSGEMAISLGRHFHRTFNTRGTLARVSLSGGAPRPILENVEWADWLPDGKTLAVVREMAGKDRLECPVGRVLYQTPGWISDIRVSPDGERIAFFDHSDPLDPRGSVAVVDLRGRKSTLSQGWATAGGLAWSPQGEEVWFTASHQRKARSLQAVALSGKVRLIARIPGDWTLHDISPDGRVLIGRDSTRADMIGRVPGETMEKDVSSFSDSTVRDISLDGRTILFLSSLGESNPPIYVGKTAGSTPVRVGEGLPCGLSPEGARVLAVVLEPSPARVVVYPVGPGEPQTLPGGSVEYSWANWFPDGKRILSTGSEPGHGRRLYVQDLAGGPPRAVAGEGVTFSWDALSPDSRWAAARDAGGTISLYPVEGGPPKPIPGLTAADEPIRWSGDGRSLYAYRRGELPARVELVDVATGRRSLWRQLMPADAAGVTGLIRIRITPDGKYYAYSFKRALSDLYVADGLK